MKSFLPNPNFQIEVFDEVFDYNKLTDLFSIIIKLNYSLTNQDHTFFSFTHRKFWSVFYTKNNPVAPEVESFILPILDQGVTPILSKYNLLPTHELHRGYVNFSNSSTVDNMHVDTPNENDYTMLIYPNMNWDIDWGGETLFYHPHTLEIITAVRPKPGRIVIFNGTIPHSARPPQQNCPEPRYTIALKFHPRSLDT
jgi:hypothetical protein